MKLSSGKRIGQSGHELAAAVIFSFFLHALVLFAAVFLYLSAVPRTYLLPFYEVKLVGQPGEPALFPQPPADKAPPVLPKQKEKAAPKGKKAAPKARSAAAHKGALPELTKQKRKLAAEDVEPGEILPEQPQTATAGKAEGVAVSTGTPQQDFKYAYYIKSVRDKIGQNWRPPPDAADAKARVIFSINRSGWVGDVNLDAEHSSGTFGFKQAAIRAIRGSNPFPPLPDDLSKQTLEFSVDLKAE